MKEIALYEVFTIGPGVGISVLFLIISSSMIFMMFTYIIALYLNFYFKRNIEPRIRVHNMANCTVLPKSFLIRVTVYTLSIFFQRYRDRLLESFPMHRTVPSRIKIIAVFFWFAFFLAILNLIVGSIFLSYVE